MYASPPRSAVGASDPLFASLEVQPLAAAIVRWALDASQIVEPTARAVLAAAGALTEDAWTANRMACELLGLEHVIHEQQLAQTSRRWLRSTLSTDREFEGRVRAVLVRTLVCSRLIGGARDPRVSKSNAVQTAQFLVQSRPQKRAECPPPSLRR